MNARNLPVYVCWDSGIDFVEQVAIVKAIEELKKLGVAKIINLGSKHWSDGPHSSADWYVNKATKRGDQLRAESILNLCLDDPYQAKERHYDIIITSSDLYADNCNFVFGLTYVNQFATVQSVSRFKNLDTSTRQASITRLILHEIGHVIGMARAGRRNTTEQLGSHCTNPGCAMRQGMNVQQWSNYAIEEKRTGKHFCAECLAEISAPKITIY